MDNKKGHAAGINTAYYDRFSAASLTTRREIVHQCDEPEDNQDQYQQTEQPYTPVRILHSIHRRFAPSRRSEHQILVDQWRC